MTRCGHVRRALDEFEAAYPALPPLTVETVWHSSWTAKEAMAFNRRSGWAKTTGVYVFVDYCMADDIHGEPNTGEERYSVIRRIGKAEYAFRDRIADYCHKLKGEQEPRWSWDWCHEDAWYEWFRYSRINVVRIPSPSAYLFE